MPDRVITAEAVISARDNTGDVFVNIARKLQEVGKGAKASAEVERLSAALSQADATAKKIDGFRVASRGLDAASLSMAKAKQTAALLAEQIAGMTKPTATLNGQMTQAERAVTKATDAFKKQGAAVREARSALAEAGVPLNRLGEEQKRLQGLVQGTTRALETQINVERQAAAMAEKVAAASRDQAKAEAAAARIAQTRVEQRAEIVRHHGVVTYGVQAAAGALAAHSIVQGEEHMLTAGAEIEHERVRLRALGKSVTEEQARAMEKQALDLAVKYPLLAQSQLMHTSRNAVAITGSPEEAMAVAEPLAKLRVIADAQHPGQDSTEDFDALVKGLEIKGVTQHPEQFLSYMNGIAKGLNAFGDTVKPSQYYDMFKYGRQATPRLSEDFILSTAPALAQELGGSSYGKAVSGFNSAVVSGVMKHTAGKEFADLGLVDPKDLDTLKTGEVKGLKAGHSLKGADLAQSDPYQWIQTYLLPALARKGITDEDGISKEIGRLFQNSTTAQLVSILATQTSKIEKDRAVQKGALGLDSAADYAGKDPFAALKGFSTSLETFAGVLTAPIMGDATKGLASLSGMVGQASERLAAFEKDHPDAAKALAVGTGVAGLAVAGTASAALLTGFGLPGASVHLEASAVALEAAAGKIGVGGAPGSTAPGKPGGPGYSLGSTSWFAALGLGSLALGAPGLDAAGDKTRDANAKALGDLGNGLGFGYVDKAREALFGKDGDLGTWVKGLFRGGPGIPIPPQRPSDLGHPADDRATRARASDADAWIQEQDMLKAASQQFGQLNDKTGIVATSFTTLDSGSGMAAQQIALLGLAARTVAGTMAGMLAGGGGAGGGAGLINASWGGGAPNLSGADRTGGPAIGHVYSAAVREANIRTYAASIGADPRVAMAVARSEGFGRFDGDRGTSFGDFQMHIGGGLGDHFRRATGKNPADPKNELALDRFALDQAKRGGWAPWHGAARIGVHGRYGLDEHPALKAPPLSRRHPDHEAPAGRAVTAQLDRVTEKLERVASAVERGGLVRHELSLPDGVKAKKTYQRGSVGSTIA